MEPFAGHNDSRLMPLAIAMTPGVNARVMLAWRESDLPDYEFFKLSPRELAQATQMPQLNVPLLKRQESLVRAQQELKFTDTHGVRVTLCTSTDYPYRLLESPDAPAVLFSVGNGSLSADKNISVVGTRRPTPYGVKMCESLVRGVAENTTGLTVTSGLAYGIDARAHLTAMDCGVPTVAVVAHGLDMIYPAAHRQLARDIASRQGLVVSEYPSRERPYRRRFLERNRIVAAMADAVLVVESGVKGGAMSTANVAFELNRVVMAVPGRACDEQSAGCNLLIRRQKGVLIASPSEVLDEMRWLDVSQSQAPVQHTLFTELSDEHMPVYNVLKSRGEILSFDTIHALSGLSVQATMSALTELEFDGVVVRYPGNRFALE